jgi:hypothetical protein
VPTFDAEVRASGRSSHAVIVPRPVVAALLTRHVLVRIGTESFETTLGTYGGRTFLGLRKPLLTALGVGAGDIVHVELEPGAAPEEVEVDAAPVRCAELDEALQIDEPLAQAWRRLPEGHREEYGRWVSGGADAGVRSARVLRIRHRIVSSR